MNGRKQRLELTWIRKEERPRVEPRILLEDPQISYHASKRVSPDDIFDNRLIHGDNLLALKALEQEFTGKIKCIYIDPPYNTGSAFEHYDDGLEHSAWLALMRDRIELARNLLSNSGSIWISIDDTECHYLKVMMDEVFGRRNFLGQVAYERSGVAGLGQGGAFLVNTHEYVLCYAKDRDSFSLENAKGEEDLDLETMKRYSRVLVSPGRREEVGRFVAPSTGEPVIVYRHAGAKIRAISLRNFQQRREEVLRDYASSFERVFRTTNPQKENQFQQRVLSNCGDGLYSADYLVSRGRSEGERTTTYYVNREIVAWLRDTAQLRGDGVVRTKKLSDFWPHADIPKADLANEGGVDFRRGKKPEALLKRILELATVPGDWVLDSFAGSGTTGAVAQKLRRRWIMAELGDHCHSLIIPRLRAVISGTDQSGISKQTEWKGGGGFRYYKLAPSLLEKDKWGNWIISREYNSVMVAEAVCKLEGFVYQPSDLHYWMHGRSSERDFIYVTTQSLTHAQLRGISEEVGEERSLLICCKAFRANLDAFANLTVKKIPKAVLERCEWGRDDYSLSIKHLLMAEEASAEASTSNGRPKGLKGHPVPQGDLFARQVGK
jgi:adenine-specific DNA-methyltransferase